MKRARPKGKAKSIKRIEKSEALKKKEILSENGQADGAEKEPYDSIIDEIQKEKKSGRARSKKAKKQKNPKKVFFIIIAILLAFIVIAMGTNLFGDDILAPLEDGKINVLMVGVDESGLRTDAIMVASYDVNEGKVNLLSIPRDTKIYITNKKITRKINAVHAMTAENDNKKILGVQATAEAVSQLTGIPINYYVEFSFLSIDHLFDSLGGVEYDVPDVEGGGRGMNYDDPYQNLHIHLKPGMQTLTGNQVQQFLRYRKSNYGVGSGSDTDRVKRQQEFIKAVIDQKLNIGLLVKIPGIFSQLSKEIKTNISTGDIAKYIRHLSKISSENINSYSLPGESRIISGASYFVCDLTATKTLMAENFGIDDEITDKITLSGKNPQTPLKAGNMTKQTSETPEANVEEQKKEVQSEPAKAEEKKPEEKEEVKPKEEEKKEDKNAPPPVEPNKTPLEDIYNLDE